MPNDKSFAKKEGNDSKDEDEIDFKSLFSDVIPLRSVTAKQGVVKKRTVTIRCPHVEQSVPRYCSADDLSNKDDIPSFRHDGVSPLTLKRLKKGYWPIKSELDLHGSTREEALLLLSAFIERVKVTGGGVRIIHGQALGSPHGPVLKRLTRKWLQDQAEVIAFCEAPPCQGGAGAVLVLLKKPRG